jgi:hypothetical protein
VDTLGFGDTKWTDDIPELIGDWLKKTYVGLNTCGPYLSQQLCLCRYKEGILLSAIVYVHTIAEARMSATPYRTLLMFRELTSCKSPLSGDKHTVNMVFLTTMWDVDLVENKEVAEKRKRI